MNNKKDFGSVISAVESASDKELAALADISSQIKKIVASDVQLSSNADTQRSAQSDTNRQEHVPRSVRVKQRTAQEAATSRHEKHNQKSLKTQNKITNNTPKAQEQSNSENNRAESQQNTNKKSTENHKNANGNISALISQEKINKKNSRKEVQEHYKNAINPPVANAYADRNGQLRDSSGRFKSASKEAAENARKKADFVSNEKKKNNEQGRLAKWLGQISDPLENDKLNEAGQAVGSTFWRSGKEFYDAGKPLVTGAYGKIKTLGQVNQEGQEAKQGLLARLHRPRQQNSQDAVSRNMAREQEKSIKEQTEAIKEGDEAIVDRLDQLLKEQGKKNGGGLMSSLLGGTALAAAAKAAGKWGKGAAIAAGAAALGGLKGIYNKVRRKPKTSTPPDASTGKGRAKPGTNPEQPRKNPGKAAQAEEKSAGKAAGKKAAETTGEKAAKKGAAEAGEAAAKKFGIKSLAKGALKVTGIGALLGAMWDAGEGYSDEDAQKKVYGTQDISTQQKASYAAASVLSLGGLGDVASEYIGKGARWAGFNGVADAVEKYNSSDMAVGINNTLDKITSYFGAEKKDKENEKTNQSELIDAIDKGTKSTTTEVKAGFASLLDFLKNPVDTVKQLAAGTYDFSGANIPPLEKALSAEGRKNLDALDEHFKALEQRDGLPANTLRTIATIESSGNPNAVGKETKYGRAKGMFQLVDSTATDLGLSGNDVFDPVKAADGASRYIKYLLKENSGDLTKAVAAYNWGIGNLQKQGMGKMPAETRDYIAKFHAYSTAAAQGKGAIPVTPANEAQPLPSAAAGQEKAKDASDLFVLNGETYRKASLPTDKLDKDSAAGEMASWGVEQLGGDKLRTAEGMRHQTDTAEIAQHAQAVRMAKAKDVRPLRAGEYIKAGNGEIYRRAELPSDMLKSDTMYGQVANWVVDNLGGDKLRDAEGMRHQTDGANGEGSLKAAMAARAAAAGQPAPGQIGTEDDGTPIVRADMVGRAVTAKPKAPSAQLPAKPIVVTDYSASNVKPPVSLGDQSISLDDESRKLLTTMNGWLKKIAGYTEDTAKTAGKQAPNMPATAQPQPRSGIPLDVSDPLMQEIAND